MKRIMFILCICLFFILIFIRSATFPQPELNNIITVHDYFGIEMWRFNPELKSYEKSWESRPIIVEKALYEKWWRRGLFYNEIALPIVSDIDNDGENELVTIDCFGLIIYGKSPAYFPFDAAGRGQLVVSDINQDGVKEIITQRNLQGGEFRIIDIWKIENDQLKKIWSSKLFEGSGFVLLLGDVDNDGDRELITARDTIIILERKGDFEWEVSAELPNIGTPEHFHPMIDVVRISDVDGDEKNEIIATGNSGMVTVYKHLKLSGKNRRAFPVLWQSFPLISPDLKPSNKESKPLVFTQGLGIGDIDGNGINEIIVGTMGLGIPPHKDMEKKGEIYIFEYSDERRFEKRWISDWTRSSGIPGFSIGDVDGNTTNEFVYMGKDIYTFDKQKSSYILQASLPRDYSKAIIGFLPDLKEPISNVRIIPIKWEIPKSIKPEQIFQASLILNNVWAEAKNVSIQLKSEDSFITIKGSVKKIGTIKAGEIIESEPFTIHVGKTDQKPEAEYFGKKWIYPTIWLEITALGGYKQSIPLNITVEL